MGFNDQEIVALSGAHALGRCHTDRSGFDGPWTFSPTTLTNDYYKLLFDEKYVTRLFHAFPTDYFPDGCGENGVDPSSLKTRRPRAWWCCRTSVVSPSSTCFSLFSCSTDYVLTTDKSFKKYAKAYADDQDLFFKEWVLSFCGLFFIDADVPQLLSRCCSSVRAWSAHFPIRNTWALDHEILFWLNGIAGDRRSRSRHTLFFACSI